MYLEKCFQDYLHHHLPWDWPVVLWILLPFLPFLCLPDSVGPSGPQHHLVAAYFCYWYTCRNPSCCLHIPRQIQFQVGFGFSIPIPVCLDSVSKFLLIYTCFHPLYASSLCVCQYLLVHPCRPPATSFGWLEWTRPWAWRMWSLKIIPLSWTPFSPGCVHGILPSRSWKGHSLLSWSPGLWSCYLLCYSC